MRVFILCVVLATIIGACQAQKCDASKGERYSDCNSACPKTCSNYMDTGTSCIQICVKGCGCPGGTIRRESDQHCVEPSQC
nr:venom peptide SjAPI-like [Parasteatoda tepidariorum]